MMKTIVITGATGGLGTEVTRTLAAEYRCIALYHGESGFERLRKDVPDVVGFQADLSVPKSVAAGIARAAATAPLYGLVHLVGGFAAGKPSETAVETWNEMMDLNLNSAFLVIREIVPHLIKNGEGRIVAIGSEAVLKKPYGTAAYTVAKSALALMIELLASELKPHRITANVLLPGALDTPAMRSEMDRSKLVPLSLVASTIRFLLSEDAAGLTGARIPLSSTGQKAGGKGTSAD